MDIDDSKQLFSTDSSAFLETIGTFIKTNLEGAGDGQDDLTQTGFLVPTTKIRTVSDAYRVVIVLGYTNEVFRLNASDNIGVDSLIQTTLWQILSDLCCDFPIGRSHVLQVCGVCAKVFFSH